MKKPFTLYSKFSVLFSGIILIFSCRQIPVDSKNNNTTTEETEPGSTPEASYSNIYNKYKGKNQIINTNEELDVFFDNGSLKAPEQIDADNFTEEKVNKLNNLLDENNKLSNEEKQRRVEAELDELRRKSQLDGNNQKITDKIKDLEEIKQDLKDEKQDEQKKCGQCNNVLTNENGTLTCLICKATETKKAADDKTKELEKAKIDLQNEKDEAKKKEKQKEIERLQQEKKEKEEIAKKAEEGRKKADEDKKKADEDRRKADEDRRKADEDRRKTEELQKEKDKQAEEGRKLKEQEDKKKKLIEEIILIKDKTITVYGRTPTVQEEIVNRLTNNSSMRQAEINKIINNYDEWISFLKSRSERELKSSLEVLRKELKNGNETIPKTNKEKKKEQGEQNKIPETAPIEQENKFSKEELIAEINDFYKNDKDVLELRNKVKKSTISRHEVHSDSILSDILSFQQITKLSFDFEISKLKQLSKADKEGGFYFQLDKILKDLILPWFIRYENLYSSYFEYIEDVKEEPESAFLNQINNLIDDFYKTYVPILKIFYGIDIKDKNDIEKDYKEDENVAKLYKNKEINSFNEYLDKIGIKGPFTYISDVNMYYMKKLQENVKISPNLKNKADELIKKLEALKTQSGE